MNSLQTSALLVTCVLLSSICDGDAGMSFPLASEDLAVDIFNDFNPNIEWDESNYLTDLAGHYATCRQEDEVGGLIEVNRPAPDGVQIGGIRATLNGTAFDTESVRTYIADTLPQWMEDRRYIPQIANAETVGCSIETACPSGVTVIACLFTPEFHGDWIPGLYEEQWELPVDMETVAMAFTEEEYLYASSVLNTHWDSSYFLENLSGLETSCGMVNNTADWPFALALREGAKWGMYVRGLAGTMGNAPSIRTAVLDIVQSWRFQVYDLPHEYLGCSVASECMVEGVSNTVVSCLFGELIEEIEE